MSAKSSNKDKNEQEYIEGWEKLYSQKGTRDMNETYEWVVELEAQGKIRGLIWMLDANRRQCLSCSKRAHGCGNRHLNESYRKSKGKSCRARDKEAEILRADICKLTGYEAKFGTVIDIGCFHSLREDDQKEYGGMLKEGVQSQSRHLSESL